ncbi:hypothetical protein ARTTLWGJ_CDS0044 [Staphylococcus phage PG-2021_35]
MKDNIEVPSVVDVEWAEEEMERTNKKKCNKDFVWYIQRNNGDIDWIDLSTLPTKFYKGKYCIDWKNVEHDITFNYGTMYRKKLIYSYTNKEHINYLLLDNYSVSSITLMKVALGNALNKTYLNTFRFSKGDIVKGCKIIDYCYYTEKSGRRMKSYKVLNIEKNVEITVKEKTLLESTSNSVFPKQYKKLINSIEGKRPDLIKYLVNEEDKYKTIGSPNKIQIKCHNKGCYFKKYISIDKLVNRGFNCTYCSEKTPLPQKVFSAYLELNNINFESEVQIDNRKRIDFIFTLGNKKLAVETHGRQHYNNSTNWGNTVKQHNVSMKYKKDYCKNNDIELIEIDCRISELSYIKESISKSKLSFLLEGVEDREIFDIIKSKDDYVLKVIELYNKGVPMRQISFATGFSSCKVSGILKRNLGYQPVKIGSSNKNAVRCLNTGKEFDGVKDAISFYNLPKGSKIGEVCRGKRKHTLAPDGTKLYWEYINGYTPKRKKVK